jgi:hypothetical protein
VILAQILTELQQIRLALTDAETGASRASDDSPTEYTCRKCPGEERVPAGERQRHAYERHNAPPEMVDGMFEVVE